MAADVAHNRLLSEGDLESQNDKMLLGRVATRVWRPLASRLAELSGWTGEMLMEGGRGSSTPLLGTGTGGKVPPALPPAKTRGPTVPGVLAHLDPATWTRGEAAGPAPPSPPPDAEGRYELDGFAESSLAQERFAEEALAKAEAEAVGDVEASNEQELHDAEARSVTRPPTLGDVLAHKAAQGHDLGAFFHVHQGRPVLDANREMCRRGIGCLLVVGDPLPRMEQPPIVGVITERDYQTKIGCGERRGTSATLAVADVMTPVHAVRLGHPGMSIYDAAQLMLKERFRHLPVVDEDARPLRVRGVISQGDIMAAILREKEHDIAVMCNYIHGDYSLAPSEV